MRKTLSAITLLAVLLGGLGAVAWTLAHSEPPPPPPAPPRPGIKVEHIEPLRWSWLHWWEANRDPYLAPPGQGRRTQERQDGEPDAVRDRAVEALLAGLDDREPGPRAACALALGLMREASALPKLKTLAGGDASDTVRAHALLALGMIEGQESQRFILGTRYPTDGQAAMQALIQHPSPWIASMALLALGRSDDPAAAQGLVEMALLTPAAQALPAWRLLEEIKIQKAGLILQAQREGGPPIGELHQQWSKAHARLMDHAPQAMPLGVGLPSPVGAPRMVGGIEDVYMARLRTAAVIALGGVDNRASVNALRRVLNESPNDYNTVPKCFAAISLGRLGATPALQDLMDIVDARAARRSQRSKYVESPLRGYAAIAVGLYARPIESPQGQSDRPRYEQAIDLLGQRLADPRETGEMRSACAVALGLTRRTEVLKGLLTLADQLVANDRPLVGYVLLARAMLGDQMILEPTRRLLALEPARDEMTSLLTRRAAVLALGVQGRREVIPTLTQAWNDVYYVNREVVLALALCGAEGVSEAVVPRLKDSTNPFERAYMARVLGRLFADSPSPLTRFLAESNFTMRDQMMLSYRALANEFFTIYLLGQFDQPWY